MDTDFFTKVYIVFRYLVQTNCSAEPPFWQENRGVKLGGGSIRDYPITNK